MNNSKATNYMHNKLSEMFGTDNYAEVMNTPMPINEMRKAAIDKAYEEATNKSTFKRLVEQYARLTAQGIKEEPYVQELLNKYK